MTSHAYAFNSRDLIKIAWPWMAPALLLILLIHLAASLHLLPAPAPSADIDQVLMAHKIEASRSPRQVRLILSGDSSCLMNLEATTLEEATGKPCLNLGLISFLNLDASTQLLTQYQTSHPDTLREVVLLFHPEALRRNNPDAWTMSVWQSFWERRLPPPGPSAQEKLRRWIGLDDFRARLMNRWLPAPLPAEFGQIYGFTQDLDRYLREHRGSAFDPRQRPFNGNAEYGLSDTLETASRHFRNSIGRHVRLSVGISPVPASFAPPQYEQTYETMLRTWGRWLDADLLLKELPATLPDSHFATLTHLSRSERERYTRELARLLTDSNRISGVE